MTITHAAEVPEELPYGSVVLDCHGIAWQRRGIAVTGLRWRGGLAQVGGDAALSWSTLLTERGPVTEIHRGTP